MKIKLDENVPTRLAGALARLGHDVDTAYSEGLSSADDETVWGVAQDAGRLLITQDMDFSDLRKFVFGKHAGVMLVRLRDPGRDRMLDRICGVFQTEDVETWKGAFVVVTDSRTRVRLPEERGTTES